MVIFRCGGGGGGAGAWGARMKVALMVNSWISPVQHQGMPGQFRSELFIGKRIEATIEDEQAIKAIKAGLKAGFKPETWIMEVIE